MALKIQKVTPISSVKNSTKKDRERKGNAQEWPYSKNILEKPASTSGTVQGIIAGHYVDLFA